MFLLWTAPIGLLLLIIVSFFNGCYRLVEMVGLSQAVRNRRSTYLDPRRGGGQGIYIFSYVLPKKGHKNHHPAPTTKQSNRTTNKTPPFPPQEIKTRRRHLITPTRSRAQSHFRQTNPKSFSPPTPNHQKATPTPSHPCHHATFVAIDIT